MINVAKAMEHLHKKQTRLVGTPDARKRACPVWGALDGNLLPKRSKALSFDSGSEAVDRYEAGVALFHAGKAPVLVCTGGWVPWYPGARPEGEILAERAVVLGVPRSHILVTNKVANTADEARAVARQLQEQRSTTAERHIILVTSAFHMRRSRMLFTRAGFQVVPFPVDFQVSVGRAFTMLDLMPTAGSLSQTETALREWYGWLFYQLVRR